MTVGELKRILSDGFNDEDEVVGADWDTGDVFNIAVDHNDANWKDTRCFISFY